MGKVGAPRAPLTLPEIFTSPQITRIKPCSDFCPALQASLWHNKPHLHGSSHTAELGATSSGPLAGLLHTWRSALPRAPPPCSSPECLRCSSSHILILLLQMQRQSLEQFSAQQPCPGFPNCSSLSPKVSQKLWVQEHRVGGPEVVVVVLCCPGEARKCSSTPKTNLLEGRKPSLLRGVCCVPTCIKVQDLWHITAWMGAWEGEPKCCNFSLSKLIFHLFPLSPCLIYLYLSSELLASTTRAGTKLKCCLRFPALNLRANLCTLHAARDRGLSAVPLVGDICFPWSCGGNFRGAKNRVERWICTPFSQWKFLPG